MNKNMWILISGPLLLLTACSDNNEWSGGSGLIEANETVVSAEISGRVLQRQFDEGSYVTVGDTLAIIDPSRIELELTAAVAGKQVVEANLKTARVKVKHALSAEQFAGSEFDRIDRMLKTGTATQRQYDQEEFEKTQAAINRQVANAQEKTVQAELARIDADIARLERQLVDCFPVSPQSGIVTEKFVEVGELLTPGKPIARITRLDTVWVKVYLPAGSFANTKVGTKSTISTETGGREYDGRVIWTSTEAEFTPKNVQTAQARADLVYAVKVSIPNIDGSLKVGMPVFVTLEQ